MENQQLGQLLEECVRAARAPKGSEPTEAAQLIYCSYRDSLCEELASLLQDAEDMKWPFVPEKWQYKQSVTAKDKTNLSDVVSKHLPQLLALLKASIASQQDCCALAVIFLVDRFLYWTDESSRLLKVAKLLHRRHCDSPVAPQLVIRQARVYLNSGKLQKAEYILSSLISCCGATGCWVYRSDSDRTLVQAVSVQVRGLILQKLGLWLEAAELIWVSLVGCYALPQPDIKGIGTSLGILANILVSMNDEDFQAFRANPDVDLFQLGDGSHRLLCAAAAAKMAVVYSQYTSLYVLTNVVTQGTCLLSYSFSALCPPAQRRSFLLQAREAFAIGLLTKAKGEVVNSQQELHTFLKAAYSLAVTHKWLGATPALLAQATRTCQTALTRFHDYCQGQDRAGLCAEIMQLVGKVKMLLQVEPFKNSDEASFIPDSYRDIGNRTGHFTLEGFAKLIQKFKKYHASICQTSNTHCMGGEDQQDGPRLCITALGTTIGTPHTECSTDTSRTPRHSSREDQPQQRAADPGSRVLVCEGKGSMMDMSCMSTEVNGEDKKLQNGKQERVGQYCPNPSCGSTETSSSGRGSDWSKFEVIDGAAETLDREEDDSRSVARQLSSSVQSLSQLALRTSSSSLGDSFGSQSSWVKLSADLNCTDGSQQQISVPETGNGGEIRSPESDDSFFLMETLDSEPDQPSRGVAVREPASRSVAEHSAQRVYEVDPNAETEVDSIPVPLKAVAKHTPAAPEADPCAPTVTSTESSFELLEAGQPQGIVTQGELAGGPHNKNPSCYSCAKQSIVGSIQLERRYLLTQQDYLALLSGVCHECLLGRLQSDHTQFQLKTYKTAHTALHLKFSKATGLWTARETCVYVGEPLGMEGKQRAAVRVQFLHQEERLSSYVGKDYLKPKEIQFHLRDVERQMTAQHYVTEFNKHLYDKEVMAQIFFIPSEALLILDGDEISSCVTVEPYMLGDFVKLTNNTTVKDKRFQATEYGIAFGHFTYLYSHCQEVVVDLQGWVTANGKGLTYLTDPQIHSSKISRGPSNFAERGLRLFLEEQHGPECNSICRLLQLPPVSTLAQKVNPDPCTLFCPVIQ